MRSEVSLAHLPQWSENIKKNFNYGDVIAVNGEMGYGKTTIIRHLINAYGSKIEATSPTFALMEVHKINDNNIILHIDAYRIKNESEVLGLGLDHFRPDNTLIFIEWPQNIPDYILRPNKLIDIQLSTQDNTRNITYLSV